MAPQFHTLTIEAVTCETADAVVLRFAVPDALRDAYRFVPGQFLTLRATIGGEDLRRSYSICRAPSPGRLFALRHALEVRSPTFACEEFYDLARKYGTAIVYAVDEDFPEIDQDTADFTYARLMSSREDLDTGVTPEELDGFAKQAMDWAKRGDVFAFFISGAKVRNPAAAQALIAKLK